MTEKQQLIGLLLGSVMGNKNERSLCNCKKLDGRLNNREQSLTLLGIGNQ
jgi:hypothetical protein